MDIGTISSRYAKALFSLAKEKGLETRVYDDMKMLADSFSLEPGLRVALGNPILPAEEKLTLLTAAGGIEVSDLYERFMHLVLEHKRESLLLFMAHIYIHLYRKDKRITRVQFSTAVPVSEEVKVHLQNKLKEETGSTIEFSGIVQPELIGGFRLFRINHMDIVICFHTARISFYFVGIKYQNQRALFKSLIIA